MTAGTRFDVYDGLSRGTGIQPRIGVTHRLDRTGTLLRAAYGRIFLTPYNENLVLASSTGAGGFVLSTFAGTHFVTPRAVQAELSVRF